jgi:hypothetical protein
MRLSSLGFSLVFAISCFADTITFSNGSVHECEILDKVARVKNQYYLFVSVKGERRKVRTEIIHKVTLTDHTRDLWSAGRFENDPAFKREFARIMNPRLSGTWAASNGSTITLFGNGTFERARKPISSTIFEYGMYTLTGKSLIMERTEVNGEGPKPSERVVDAEYQPSADTITLNNIVFSRWK